MEAKMMDIPGFVSFMRYYAGYAAGIASINSSAMHAVHSLCTSNPHSALVLPHQNPCLGYDTTQDTSYFAEPYASVDACIRSAC